MPAAAKAWLALWRKMTMVLPSSAKTTGMRLARMMRKRPNPSARKIPIGPFVMDKLLQAEQRDRWHVSSFRSLEPRCFCS
jgi:hypothetical protein